VKLNIYDFCRGNGILKIICLGGYHSAVQVDEKEYKYEAHSALTTGVSDGSVNEENLQLIESIDYGTVQV
jgi:tRNA1(Val) A37 N6-methylase TrmN6